MKNKPSSQGIGDGLLHKPGHGNAEKGHGSGTTLPLPKSGVFLRNRGPRPIRSFGFKSLMWMWRPNEESFPETETDSTQQRAGFAPAV